MSSSNLAFERGFPVIGELSFGSPKRKDGGIVLRARLVVALDKDALGMVRFGRATETVQDEVLRVAGRKQGDPGIMSVDFTSKLAGFDVMLEVVDIFDGAVVTDGNHPRLEVKASVLMARVGSGRNVRYVLTLDLRPGSTEVLGQLVEKVGSEVQVRVLRHVAGDQEQLPFGGLLYVPEDEGSARQLELHDDEEDEDDEEELPAEPEPEVKPKRGRARADVQPTVLDGAQ